MTISIFGFVFAILAAVLLVRVADVIVVLFGSWFLKAQQRRFDRWCEQHEVIYEEE